MDKLRIRFSKTGRAVYLSHLDLMRTMQRAFLRADIPIRYSEGFNPHAIISIALPLSVGTASVCEFMDFKLRGFMSLSEIPFRLNQALPEGIQVLEAYEWERKFKDIKWLDVDGIFEYDERNPEALLSPLSDFFAQDGIEVTKKSKKGLTSFDLSPALRSISLLSEKGCIRLKALVSAQEPTLNPNLLAAALTQLSPELAPDFAFFVRREAYDSEMNIFR
jgi:radical SAM-linked protein